MDESQSLKSNFYVNPRNHFLEKNYSKINEIASKYGFAHGYDLPDEVWGLSLFANQIEATANDLGTPSKNKERLLAIMNSAKELKRALNRLSKQDILMLNKLMQSISVRNLTFVHSLEAKMRSLQEYSASEKAKNEYGQHNAKLIYDCSVELLSALNKARLNIKIKIDHFGYKRQVAEEVIIEPIEKDLAKLITKCKRLGQKPIKEGRPYGAVTRNLVIKLMWVYEGGTGGKPAITSTGVPTCPYSSTFYDFLKDIFPFIQERLPKNKTINQVAALACDTLPYYRELKRFSVSS